MDNLIGHVVAVAGSQMTATLEVDALTEDPVRIGAMVKARSAHLDVIGTIGTINAEGGGSPPRSLMVVDLLGEASFVVLGESSMIWRPASFSGSGPKDESVPDVNIQTEPFAPAASAILLDELPAPWSPR